ncbi:unnamed protein product, partial [Sphacelaria rigidula]
GLSADGTYRLRDSLACCVDTFRRALRDDPPARVEPMREAVKAKPRRHDPDARTEDRVRAWRAAQDLVAQAVPLYHPRPGCVVLMFPDAPDLHLGSFLTQVPVAE